MKKSRFTEDQIVGVLREQEAGARRRMSAASTALANRRSTVGRRSTVASMSDAQKLKTLEDENRRLKKLLAESMLDVAALKDLSQTELARRATRRGAHLLLQTRTRALDGTLRPLFEQRYPGLANDNGAAPNQAAAA